MQRKQITVFTGVLIKDRKILMNLRREDDLTDAHLKWELPGGKCEWNEKPEEAIKREFLEETGVVVSVKKLLPFIHTSYWEYPWGTQQTFILAFLCEYVEQTDRQEDSHIEAVEWIDLDMVEGLETLPGVKEVIRLAIAFPQ